MSVCADQSLIACSSSARVRWRQMKAPNRLHRKSHLSRPSAASEQPLKGLKSGAKCSTKRRPFYQLRFLIPPEDIIAEHVRVYLGRRLDCARYHDHPFEAWSQDQFWGMAASMVT